MEKLTALEVEMAILGDDLEEVNYFEEVEEEPIVVSTEVSNNSDILELVKRHIVEHGGATVDSGSGYPMNITQGYGVAVEVSGLTAVKPIEEYTVEDYNHDIEIIEELDTYAGQSIKLGYWLNNGLLYVDASIVVNDVMDAVNIANLTNQLAIFDFGTEEDITLREDHNVEIPQYQVMELTSTCAHAEVSDVNGVIELEVDKYGHILFNGKIAKIIKVKYIPIIKVLQQLIERHRDTKVYTNGEYIGRINEFGELY